MTLLELLSGPWAIAPDKLLELQAIYATHMRGEKIDVAAIEARLGRPLANEQQRYEVEHSGIAVLRLNGVMAPKANLLSEVSGGISTQKAAIQIESARLDGRVRGLVLAMDTPGGNVLGTPEFADVIAEFAKAKPLVVWSDGQLASAGYWAASAANAIYVSSNVVQVGSIGVVHNRSYNPNSPVVEENITAGRYKRLVNSREPYSEEARAVVQADVDYVYSLFVDTVAGHRGVTSEQVLEHMADGRVFRGQQAIDAGLVDGVATLDDLIDQMAAKPESFSYENRRKAVFASVGSESESVAAGAPEDTTASEKQESDMGDPITRESFERDHAALFAQIRNEGLAAGADAERARIQAVLAVGDGLPGHAAVLQAMAFDGKSTEADATKAVLNAEKQARASAAKAHADDAPDAAAPSVVPKDGATDAAALTEQAKALAKEKGIDLVAAFQELGVR